ncbi:MAG: zinc ribbon domain-containing protein YjdM [Verrucomicrobiota bacterium]
MSTPTCPMCEMNEVLEFPEKWECVTCGHEWNKPPAPYQGRVVKDAYGSILADGDIVALIKDLPLKGSSQILRTGAKSKTIKLVDGDHEISCKVDGVAVGLKACFVKKVPA